MKLKKITYEFSGGWTVEWEPLDDRKHWEVCVESEGHGVTFETTKNPTFSTSRKFLLDNMEQIQAEK